MGISGPFVAVHRLPGPCHHHGWFSGKWRCSSYANHQTSLPEQDDEGHGTPLQLFRDGEVIAQGLTAAHPPAQLTLALVDDMAAWLGPVGVRRGTRVRDLSAHPPPWLTVVS